MAVVTRPLRGPQQCLLVNCLNQGQHEYPRDRGVQIRVYPKSTISSERRASLTKFIRSGDDETHRCFDIMQNGSCRSGIPKFFYNSTSSRCERFFTGCGSNRNTFDTQQACDALCSQKFLCYRPMERGQRPPLRFSDPTDDLEIGPPNFFFYNISSSKCEAFYFRGSASNGNIFRTERECESFCGGVQAPSASRPADSGETRRAAPLFS
ncbi:boophilin-H2-like [Plectropomus leopardus]|uniref:boophilin-H2-like n=1 Tax=Plectropomus leopardus TaxID=160734 RepID=UPI001C4D13A6|nr:boophilin-H2-like [Plectropomus leopardus]